MSAMNTFEDVCHNHNGDLDKDDEDGVGDSGDDSEEIFYDIDMFGHDVFHSRRARI